MARAVQASRRAADVAWRRGAHRSLPHAGANRRRARGRRGDALRRFRGPPRLPRRRRARARHAGRAGLPRHAAHPESRRAGLLQAHREMRRRRRAHPQSRRDRVLPRARHSDDRRLFAERRQSADAPAISWARASRGATISYDLNIEQVLALLAAAPPAWFELTLHQHMPMFHMEHCVFAAFMSKGTTFLDCGRPCEKHRVHLRDRVGMEHPLRADVGCRNTLFNAVPQTGARFFDALQQAGLRHFRVELLEEDAAPNARGRRGLPGAARRHAQRRKHVARAAGAVATRGDEGDACVARRTSDQSSRAK